jgi:hypothetical protein
MTYLAGHFALAAMVQGKCVAAQLRRQPAVGSMAVLALQPKKASVDLGFTVTPGAVLRDALEDLACMAGFASQFGVSSLQREDIGVIEIAHLVESIVAIQAIFTKLADMFRYKSLVLFCMACDTRLTSEPIYPGWMASPASQCLASIIQPVSCE